MAGRPSTAASSAPGTRISIVSALQDAVKSAWERQSPDWRHSRRQSGDWRSQACTDTLRIPLAPRKKEAPVSGCLSYMGQKSKMRGSAKSSMSSVLWRWRRLLAFPSMSASSVSSALHLLEGWIRGEERRGGRLPDARQLVGRRPEARIGVRIFQEKIQARSNTSAPR